MVVILLHTVKHTRGVLNKLGESQVAFCCGGFLRSKLRWRAPPLRPLTNDVKPQKECRYNTRTVCVVVKWFGRWA